MLLLRKLSSVLCYIAVFTTAGCADKYEGRMEVSGKVTLKGKPIPDEALVEFVPLEEQGTASTAMTKGGAYQIPRESGLKPGKYLVRLSAGDGKTAVNPVNPDSPPGPGGGSNIVSKDLIPRDWGRNSKQERTVTSQGPNVFDFTIP